MGTITIKVPKDIDIEYKFDSVEATENLLEKLNEIKMKSESVKLDKLLGLFANEVELIDNVIESAMKARENDPIRVS
jgi:uncharacterized protein involved in tellurium resistance